MTTGLLAGKRNISWKMMLGRLSSFLKWPFFSWYVTVQVDTWATSQMIFNTSPFACRAPKASRPHGYNPCFSSKEGKSSKHVLVKHYHNFQQRELHWIESIQGTWWCQTCSYFFSLQTVDSFLNNKIPPNRKRKRRIIPVHSRKVHYFAEWVNWHFENWYGWHQRIDVSTFAWRHTVCTA